MNRFVNIFMLLIVISCPIRCLLQECGCYKPIANCCVLGESCSSLSPPSCCSTHDCCESRPADQECPLQPQKCECSCFCSGVIVADVFSVPKSSERLAEVLKLESNLMTSIHSQALRSSGRAQFPGDPPDFSTENSGRQLRCRLASFLI